MSQRLKFGIIGCGKIAPRHADQIIARGNLAAVCDIDKERADLLAAQYSATPYYNIDHLLEMEKDIDIISVCTPNGLHAEHSIKSLQAGKHVICEKPMCLSFSAGISMRDTAYFFRKKLFVVKQNRFNPPVVFVKRLVDEKRLGKIFSFMINCFWNRSAEYYKNTWRGTLVLDGGTLYTQFSHFIDILYWMLGEVSDAKGLRDNFLHKNIIEFEDTGAVLLQMKNGALGTLHYTVNAHQKNMEGSITLFGEKGTVKIGGQYLNKLEYFSVGNEPMPQLPESAGPNQYSFYEGSMSNHDKVYENVIAALNDPGYTFVEAGEALKTIEIIEKIYAATPFLQQPGNTT